MTGTTSKRRPKNRATDTQNASHKKPKKGHKAKEDMENETTTQNPISGLDSTILQLMQCKTCFEYPRGRVIYQCNTGHVICIRCYENSNAAPERPYCPLCTDTGISTSPIIPQVLGQILAEQVFSCRNAKFGCMKNLKWKHLSLHEETCQYRILKCMSIDQKKPCCWTGPMADLPEHVGKLKCANIIGNQPRESMLSEVFISHIGDFDNTEISVFNCHENIEWIPSIFLGRVMAPYMVYIAVERTKEGQWLFVIKTHSPESIARKLEYKLEILDPKTIKSFSLVGTPVSSKMTNAQARGMGHCMVLEDAQLRRGERNILNYSVTIRILPGDNEEDSEAIGYADIHELVTPLATATITAQQNLLVDLNQSSFTGNFLWPPA